MWTRAIRLMVVLAMAATVTAATGTAAAVDAEIFTDRAAFRSACPELPVEDFEEASFSGVLDFPGPLSESTSNATFSPGDILPGVVFSTAGPSERLVALGPGYHSIASMSVFAVHFGQTFSIDFTEGNVTGVGLDLLSVKVTDGSGAGSLSVSVYGASGLLLSTSAPSNSSDGRFLGIEAGEPITRIVVSPPPFFYLQGVDDVEFGFCVTPPADVLAEIGATLTGIEHRRVQLALALLGDAVDPVHWEGVLPAGESVGGVFDLLRATVSQLLAARNLTAGDAAAVETAIGDILGVARGLAVDAIALAEGGAPGLLFRAGKALQRGDVLAGRGNPAGAILQYGTACAQAYAAMPLPG